jgi:hypothetical protein
MPKAQWHDTSRPPTEHDQQRGQALLPVDDIEKIGVGLIRDRWTSLNPANVGRVQRFLTESYVDGDRRYRLRSGDANWVVFRSYVLAEPTSIDRREWINFGQKEDAHVRARNAVLASNADRLARKLDGWLEKFTEADRVVQLERLERTILDGLEFVKIHVTKVADAFVIFETLNDRGLALSAGDLLKNHLLQNGARDGVDLEDMAERWEEVIANLQPLDPASLSPEVRCLRTLQDKGRAHGLARPPRGAIGHVALVRAVRQPGQGRQPRGPRRVERLEHAARRHVLHGAARREAIRSGGQGLRRVRAAGRNADVSLLDDLWARRQRP